MAGAPIEILFYAYFQDMSFAHLAEKLAISEQTVYQSRRNAVAWLPEILYNARNCRPSRSHAHPVLHWPVAINATRPVNKPFCNWWRSAERRCRYRNW